MQMARCTTQTRLFLELDLSASLWSSWWALLECADRFSIYLDRLSLVSQSGSRCQFRLVLPLLLLTWSISHGQMKSSTLCLLLYTCLNRCLLAVRAKLTCLHHTHRRRKQSFLQGSNHSHSVIHIEKLVTTRLVSWAHESTLGIQKESARRQSSSTCSRNYCHFSLSGVLKDTSWSFKRI